MSDYKPSDVRKLKCFVQDYVDEKPVGPHGHRVYTYAEAVGLQVLERDYAAARELTLIKGGNKLPNVIQLEDRRKEAA